MKRGIIGAIVLLPVVFTSVAAHAWHAGWSYYLFGPLMWIVSIGLVWFWWFSSSVGSVARIILQPCFWGRHHSKFFGSGVRALCADCHVSGRLTFAMREHFIGTGELFVWLTHDFSTPGAFEKLRPAAAQRVRMEMLENDSKTCRTCHVMEGIKPKRKRGQWMHTMALEEGTTCIACHYNLVHEEVEPSKVFLEAIEGG